MFELNQYFSLFIGYIIFRAIILLAPYIYYYSKKYLVRKKIIYVNMIENNNYYYDKVVILVISLLMIFFIFIGIYYLVNISKDIKDSNQVLYNNGTITSSMDKHFVIIDNKIYPIIDYNNSILRYHVDNKIEVKFYYYKYSKCIQYIEFQEIPDEANTG